jgi:hypothetical protein
LPAAAPRAAARTPAGQCSISLIRLPAAQRRAAARLAAL